MRAHYADVWRRVAQEVPLRPAIVSVSGPSYTYGEFDDAAARLASLLLANGVGPHDKVALLLHNRAEWMLTLYAAYKLGAAPVAINFRYGPREAGAIVDDSDAVALVYPRTLAAVAAEVAAARPGLFLLEVDDGGSGSAPDAHAFEDYASFPPLEVDEAPADGELFLYTGGTTGVPKGVVWGVQDMFEIQQTPAYVPLRLQPPSTFDEAIGLAVDPATPRPVTLPIAPFLHGTAFTTSMNTLLLGGTIVVAPSARFDAEQVARIIPEYGVTRLIVAGDAVAVPFLDALDALGIRSLPTLTSVMSSGMRFADTTKERLHTLGGLTITDILAATEGGPFAFAITASVADLPSRFRLNAGAVVFDEGFAEVQDTPGAVGRLAYRGGMPKGYYKDPAKTAATFPVVAGIRHVVPGDLVRIADDGAVELLGRGSTVVNTGGEKVFPAEVEESLLRHPLVVDAVVFGVPDPRWGEVVAAAVAVEDVASVTEAELIAHVGGELAGFKKPRRVLIERTLGRTPSGKVEIARFRERGW